MAMCLYSYVPTRAAQQFVDDIFDFTVSDTELYRIIEQSKDAYKKCVMVGGVCVDGGG
jgi:hypothetical protein